MHDTRVPFDPAILSSCAQATPARFTDLAHQAPLGMVQYNGSTFPTAYQGNLFVAYHGSWNSTAPRDCKVQMIVIREGVPIASQPFLTGFRTSDTENCGSAWGRPAGIAVGAKANSLSVMTKMAMSIASFIRIRSSDSLIYQRLASGYA